MKTNRIREYFALALSVLCLAVITDVITGGTIAEAAIGHIGIGNVSQELRTRTLDYRFDSTQDDNDAPADATVGIAGVIYATTSNAVTSYSVTSGIYSPPYPCKLLVGFFDADATGGAAEGNCAVTIIGQNQFGTPISETTAAAGETFISSARVFEKVTSISATGCTAGTAAGDELILKCGEVVGLGLHIQSASAVLSVCREVAAGTSFLCATSAAITSAVDLDDDAINLEAITGVEDLVDGDRVVVRVRAPSGK